MKSYIGLAAICATALVVRACGFVVSPGREVLRCRDNYDHVVPRLTAAKPRHTVRRNTESSTSLFGKAKFKNFEDMLAQEPGALLVDFYATWCGPCKMMADVLAEVGPMMKDEMKIFKIDSDKYPALMNKFKVNGLPTLILFKEGKELTRIEGVLPAASVVHQVQYWLSGRDEDDNGQQSRGSASSASQQQCSPPQDACKPPGDVCIPPVD